MKSACAFFAAKGTEWYSAFNQPSAQCRNNRTYVAFPNEDFDPVVICYDHKRRSWSKPVKVGKNPLSPARDSHGNPALLIDEAGYLHVFYGCHGGPMRYARSAKPEDISCWMEMPAPAPNATYPQVMQMSNATILLFYRAGGHCDNWVLRTSDDGGGKWSQETAVIHGSHPRDAWYATFVKGPGDTVHVGFCYKDDINALKAPGPEFTHRYDIFYMRRTANGVWQNAAGTRLKLPLSKEDANALCKVYDSLSRNELTGACSLGIDERGTPYILFRSGGLYGTTSYQHKLARFKGKKWEVVNVGPAVDAGYSAFPRDDNFVLRVLSANLIRAYVVNIVAARPTKTDLEEWESADSGRIWARKKTIFSSTEYHAGYVLIAPKLVADPHPDGFLVFGETKRYLYGDSGFVKNPHPK